MTWIVAAQLAVVAGLLALWIRDRQKFKSQIAQLHRRLMHVESTCGEFMRECEKTFTELSSRMNHRTEAGRPERVSSSAPGDSRPVGRLRLSLEEEKVSHQRPAEPVGKTVEGASFRGSDLSHKQNIASLANQGLAPKDIASRLGIPQGEVELILNLRKAATHVRKTGTLANACHSGSPTR